MKISESLLIDETFPNNELVPWLREAGAIWCPISVIKLWEITVPAFPRNSISAQSHNYKVVDVAGDKIAVSTSVAIPTKTTTFPLPSSYWADKNSLFVLFLSSLAHNSPFGSGDPRNIVHNVFDDRIAYNLTLASSDRIEFLESAAAQDLALITGLHPNLTLPKITNWSRAHISPRKPAAAEGPIASPSQITRPVASQMGHRVSVSFERFASGVQTLRVTPKTALLLVLLLLALVWAPGLAVLILIAAAAANFNAPSMRFLRDFLVESAWAFPRVDTPGLEASAYEKRQEWIKAKEDFSRLELEFYNVDKDPKSRLTSHLALYITDLPETARFFTAFSAAQNAVTAETRYKKGSSLPTLVGEAKTAWADLEKLSAKPELLLTESELKTLGELKDALNSEFSSEHELRTLNARIAVAVAELPRVSLPTNISILDNRLLPSNPSEPVRLTKPVTQETKSLERPKP